MKFYTALVTLFFFLFISKMNAQELTMFPGTFGYKYYEDDQQISLSKVNELLSQNEASKPYWQKSKRHLGFGWASVAVFGASLIWATSNDNNGKSQTGPTVGIIASSIPLIGFSISANKNRREAFLRYNKEYDVASIRFGQTRNGVGLVVGFQ